MSVQAVATVWRHSRAKGSELLLLLAIADHAKDDGSGAWPSIETLAHKTRLSERAVQYLIRRLEASRELTVETGASPRGTNIYNVHIPGQGAKFSPGQGAKIAPPGVQASVKAGAKSGARGVQPVAPDPSLDPSDQPSSKSVERDQAPRRLFTHFRDSILKTAKDTPDTRRAIAVRLAAGTFAEDELHQAIDHFAADGFCMRENAARGAAWFFADEKRLEHWLNMRPDANSHLPPRERSGRRPQDRPGADHDPDRYLKGEWGHLFRTGTETGRKPKHATEPSIQNPTDPIAAAYRKAERR